MATGAAGSVLSNSTDLTGLLNGLGTMCFSLKNRSILACAMSSCCGSDSTESNSSTVVSSMSAGFKLDISSIVHLNFDSSATFVAVLNTDGLNHILTSGAFFTILVGLDHILKSESHHAILDNL